MVTRTASFHVGDSVLYLPAFAIIGTVSLIKTELQLQGGGSLRVASSSCVPEGDNNEGIRLESVHGGNVAGADKCDAQKFGDVAARKRNLDWRSRTGC